MIDFKFSHIGVLCIFVCKYQYVIHGFSVDYYTYIMVMSQFWKIWDKKVGHVKCSTHRCFRILSHFFRKTGTNFKKMSLFWWKTRGFLYIIEILSINLIQSNFDDFDENKVQCPTFLLVLSLFLSHFLIKNGTSYNTEYIGISAILSFFLVPLFWTLKKIWDSWKYDEY